MRKDHSSLSHVVLLFTGDREDREDAQSLQHFIVVLVVLVAFSRVLSSFRFSCSTVGVRDSLEWNLISSCALFFDASSATLLFALRLIVFVLHLKIPFFVQVSICACVNQRELYSTPAGTV